MKGLDSFRKIRSWRKKNSESSEEKPGFGDLLSFGNREIESGSIDNPIATPQLAGPPPLPAFRGVARDPEYRSQLEEFALNPAIMLELSSCCNFHCPYCRSSLSDRQKGTMSRELVNHLLPQLKALTRRRLRLHIDGEPMLHPHFYDICQDANRAGFRLAVASNASLLRNEYLRIEMDLFINLSTCAEEHAKRSAGNFRIYMERIKNYLLEWIRDNIPQDIHLKVYFDANESCQEEVMLAKRKFVRGVVAAFGFDGHGCWMPPTWQPEFSYRNNSGHVLHVGFQQVTEGGLYPNLSGVHQPGDAWPPTRGFCDSPWKILAIHSDGSIGFCCVDITGKTIFTSPEEIWEKPLLEIWHDHPILRKARQEFLEGEVKRSICQKCLENSPCREMYLFTEIFPDDPRS
jgi:MoaA/NifB/PqqE/SkfB family radical SAM enzyme